MTELAIANLNGSSLMVTLENFDAEIVKKKKTVRGFTVLTLHLHKLGTSSLRKHTDS